MAKMCGIGVILRKARITDIVLNIEIMKKITKEIEELGICLIEYGRFLLMRKGKLPVTVE